MSVEKASTNTATSARSALSDSLQHLYGKRTVPQVFVGGHHIGGHDDTVEAHESGRLELLLSEHHTTTPRHWFTKEQLDKSEDL